MVRNYKPVNRPPHICSCGPYRRKREHVEDLARWDCRDYIDQALPDIDDTWDDEDDYESDDMPVLTGHAEADPCDSKYSVFRVEVEAKPGHVQPLQLYRGSPFPNTPLKQRNYWWYWICPECDRRCRYLHSIATSGVIICHKCWNVVYRSQSKSPARRQQERLAKNKALNMGYFSGAYGDKYWLKNGRTICWIPPTPPPGWVPEDLLKRFYAEDRSQRAAHNRQDREMSS